MQAAEVLKIRGRATRSDNIPDLSALKLGTTTHMHTCHACGIRVYMCLNDPWVSGLTLLPRRRTLTYLLKQQACCCAACIIS